MQVPGTQGQGFQLTSAFKRGDQGQFSPPNLQLCSKCGGEKKLSGVKYSFICY